MSRLATTPGNRLVIPTSSTASGCGPGCRVSSHGTLHASVRGRHSELVVRSTPHGGGRDKSPGPHVVRPRAPLLAAWTYLVLSGTVILPLMMSASIASILALMSSTWPPDVA